MYAKPMAVPEIRHNPFSAFMALVGIILPFLFWEDSIFIYLLILSPLYLVYSSKWLALGLLATAVLWPHITERNMLMRLVLIVDSVYIGFFASKSTKYKITPTKVPNNDFVFLI